MKYIIIAIMAISLMSCSVCREYETDVLLLGQTIIDDYKAEILKSDRTDLEKEIITEACDQYLKMLRKE